VCGLMGNALDVCGVVLRYLGSWGELCVSVGGGYRPFWNVWGFSLSVVVVWCAPKLGGTLDGFIKDV
jgi:hypothetical protein